MTDLKRLTEDATTKAAIAVGKDAAKRAALELLSGKEESLSEGDKPGSKNRRWKIAAVAVLGLFLVVGLIGLLMNYWVWFLAAGVVGLAGLVGFTRLRRRLGTKSKEAPVQVDAATEKSPAKVAAPDSTRAEKHVEDVESARANQEKRKAEREAEARALAEAEALREQEVDDELAAMKARLKR